MKLEGPTHLFLVEICFATNLFTWGYSRIYLYGYHVVYMGGWVLGGGVPHHPTGNVFADFIGTGYWLFNSLMSSLIVMHVIWYVMCWRLLHRLLTKETAHDAGRDEYEGDSDSD